MDMNNEKDLKKEAPLAQDHDDMKLDDARRVKVLSPGMLVFKRFIRNKLAVVGIIILVFMFVFAFVGPLFSPYTRAQIFTKDVEEPGKYATGKYNTDDPRLYGESSGAMKSAVLKAIGEEKKKGLKVGQEISFDVDGEPHTLRVISPRANTPTCGIFGTKMIASIDIDGNMTASVDEVDENLREFLMNHYESRSRETKLEYKGITITADVAKVGNKYYVASDEPVALFSYNLYTATLGKVAELQADVDFLHEVSEAVMDGETSITYNDKTYNISGDAANGFLLSGPDGAGLFNITRDNRFGKVSVEKTDAEGNVVNEEVDFVSTIEDVNAFLAGMNEAMDADETSFSYGDNEYSIERAETEIHVTNSSNELVLTVSNSFDAVETKYDELKTNMLFLFELETAIAKGASTFQYEGENYIVVDNGADYSVLNGQRDDIMMVSDIACGADYVGIELTVDFIKKLQDAMRSNESEFSFVNQYGELTDATITVVNGNYYVSTMQKTSLIDSRSAPSGSHLMGTDVNGMDVFTRLMYGGRVSLIVGFVVVFFEIFIGVIVGGISGFFGGVVDTILMRFVELFNAIPFYPMLIIVGSVMGAQHVDAYSRLMLTMVILGVLGWTFIARVVRGQILSLREQDFMVAAEATGIRTSRRIFKHLVPNVMPLLIVNATSSLGSVILTEATLGFLGLGVKYPMASWGAIITQVNDMQVMKTAWWIWIPAGLFIMITVLGFNFVGDGLRDAFDPKMKR